MYGERRNDDKPAPVKMGLQSSAGSSASHLALRVLAALGGLLASLWINFHWLLPDFRLVPGDLGDSRLVIYTLEHWFRVLGGLEPFFRLGMFYPDPNALAYADGLLLLGLPYSALRLAGLDYFTSYQWVMILLTAIGYATWSLLLSRILRVPAVLAMVGGVLLSSLNALQLQADIGKLAAINLFPVLILWLWSYVAAKDRGRWRPLAGLTGFAAGLGLLFFTSYYPAWLLTFGMAILGLVALIAGVAFDGPHATIAAMRRAAGEHWRHVVLALAAFGIALIPFLVTYSPLIAGGSKRSLELALAFTPRPWDVVNVSAANVVWSPLLRQVGFDFGNREIQMGTPVLVLLIAACTALAIAWRARKAGWHGITAKDRMLLTLAVTGAALVLISLKVGNASLWYWVHRLVPGATALRAIGRMLILMDLIVVIVAVCGLERMASWWRSRARLGRRGALLLLPLLSAALIVEQVNWTPFKLDKAEQIEQMEPYRAPEIGCEAFYVTNARPNGLPFGYYQLDAMMISMKLGIPTVNGYSGFEPHEAFTLAPTGPEYRYRILDWLISRGATKGICELDTASAGFRPVDVAREYPIAQGEFRARLLQDFSMLHAAASQFLRDGNDLTNLYPRYLEEHGYLDPAIDYETGTRYRWLGGRYWLGNQACGRKQCFAIGVEGELADLQPILDVFEPLARQALFPYPAALGSIDAPSGQAAGELRLVFPIPEPRE